MKHHPVLSFPVLVAAALAGATLAPAAAFAAPLRVVTTLPDLAWAAQPVGGDRVQARALCAAWEDPHFVSPTPALIAEVSGADVFVEVGLGLEPWTERVLDGAANPRIRPGAAGYVKASSGISTLERPETLSRSQGDLHPEGNPHVWMDPVLMKVVATNIADGLARVDPSGADGYRKNLAALHDRVDRALYGPQLVDLLGGSLLDRLSRGGQLGSYLGKVVEGRPLSERLGGWLLKSRPMQGCEVVFYHQSWVYFAQRFGVQVAAHIEEKPGIPPSAAHRERVLSVMKERHVRLVAIATFDGQQVPQALARDAGAKLEVVPMLSGGTKDVPDWFALMDWLVSRIAGHCETGP
jgi:zinc/manganese transport system substrate-binding protein